MSNSSFASQLNRGRCKFLAKKLPMNGEIFISSIREEENFFAALANAQKVSTAHRATSIHSEQWRWFNHWFICGTKVLNLISLDATERTKGDICYPAAAATCLFDCVCETLRQGYVGVCGCEDKFGFSYLDRFAHFTLNRIWGLHIQLGA